MKNVATFFLIVAVVAVVAVAICYGLNSIDQSRYHQNQHRLLVDRLADGDALVDVTQADRECKFLRLRTVTGHRSFYYGSDRYIPKVSVGERWRVAITEDGYLQFVERIPHVVEEKHP